MLDLVVVFGIAPAVFLCCLSKGKVTVMARKKKESRIWTICVKLVNHLKEKPVRDISH